MQLVIIGAGGGVGAALVNYYSSQATQIEAISRQGPPAGLPKNVHWHQVEGELGDYEQLFAQWVQEKRSVDGFISTIGWLHDDEWQPEKNIESLDADQLQAYFAINATLPIMLLKAAKPLLRKDTDSFYVQLGAKVGSISDNHLGGWYGYRASKAALNMLFKTAAIEFSRTHKKLSLAVIHPGTTDTALSEPFQARIRDDKLYTPEQTAERMASVIAGLQPSESGGFWFWDGTPLPY